MVIFLSYTPNLHAEIFNFKYMYFIQLSWYALTSLFTDTFNDIATYNIKQINVMGLTYTKFEQGLTFTHSLSRHIYITLLTQMKNMIAVFTFHELNGKHYILTECSVLFGWVTPMPYGNFSSFHWWRKNSSGPVMHYFKQEQALEKNQRILFCILIRKIMVKMDSAYIFASWSAASHEV